MAEQTLYQNLGVFKDFLRSMPDGDSIILNPGYASLQTTGKKPVYSVRPAIIVEKDQALHTYLHGPVARAGDYEKLCKEAEAVAARIARHIIGELERSKRITVDVGNDQLDLEIVTRENNLGYTPGNPLRVQPE